jgi:hypothetical protein
MGTTSGSGTAYPKEASEFTPGFCEIHVAQSSFLWIIIFPLSFGHCSLTVLTSLTLYICLYWTLFYIEKQ